MVGQTVAYVRVSSAEQNLDRQLEAVGECDRIFQDKISGSSRAKRAGLAELIGYVREGDLVKVASMDRLGLDRTEACGTTGVSSFALCRGFRCVPCRVRWCR